MATRKPRIKRYYIVNPAGAIHEVTKEHASNRLRQTGWRMASADEVKAYKSERVQRFDRPLAQPWTDEPDGFEEEVEAAE